MWALSLPANPDKPSFRPYHTAQGLELRQPHLHVDIAVTHGFTEPSLSWAGQGSGPSERPPGFKPRVRTVVTWVIIQWAQQKLAVCFCWGCPGAAVQTYPGSAPSNTRFLITAPLVLSSLKSFPTFGWQGWLSWPVFTLPDSTHCFLLDVASDPSWVAWRADVGHNSSWSP